MKQDVILTICGRQTYEGQEPDVIELTTDGTMEFHDGGWNISYEESELTGLQGVTTTFRVEPGRVTLNRTGKLHSRMVFQEGTAHESLYQMEFGALLVTVCADRCFMIWYPMAARLIWFTALRLKTVPWAWWITIWISGPKTRKTRGSREYAFISQAEKQPKHR